MTDFFPLLLAVLIFVLTFISAMNNGVVKLLASGMAAFVLLVILILGIQFLPWLGQTFLDVDLTWKVTLGFTCVIAILAYTISRFVFGWFFKRVLGPDGWFHWMADGVPGGVVSLLPSLVIVIFLFSCTRIAGTVLELNYVATLCQPQVTNTITKLPPYPFAAEWRNAIERIPLFPEIFDLLDPLTNRANRNTAVLVMVDRSIALKQYFKTLPVTAPLIEAPELSGLSADENIVEMLKAQERLSLVNATVMKDYAASFPAQEKLKQLDFQPVLEGFVASLKPLEIPSPAAAN